MGMQNKLCLKLILEIFDEPRKKFNYFQNNPSEVTIALAKGAQKAHKIATDVLMRVRSKIGY